MFGHSSNDGRANNIAVSEKAVINALYFNTIVGPTGSNFIGPIFEDDVFRVRHFTGTDKDLAFDCGNIATSTTRTFTAPNANGTLPANPGFSSNLSLGGPADTGLASFGGQRDVMITPGVGVGPIMTTGDDNTGLGYKALAVNASGGQNTAVGSFALESNNGVLSVNNTAVGYQALADNTSAARGTAIGALALAGNTIGSDNTAVGFSALAACSSGDLNVAVGSGAAIALTVADRCTAVGFNALKDCTTGSDNTAIGALAFSAGTGGANTMLGSQAALVLTTGDRNTACGGGALKSVVTGSDNTVLGHEAGIGLTLNDTANICIGSGTSGVVGSNSKCFIGPIPTVVPNVSYTNLSYNNTTREVIQAAPFNVYATNNNGAIQTETARNVWHRVTGLSTTISLPIGTYMGFAQIIAQPTSGPVNLQMAFNDFNTASLLLTPPQKIKLNWATATDYTALSLMQPFTLNVPTVVGVGVFFYGIVQTLQIQNGQDGECNMTIIKLS